MTRILGAAGTDRAGDDPASPLELTRQSWWYVVRKTVREFSKDECLDLAAALTYYAVLALFPALIALLSLVGLVGQGQSSAEALLDILEDMGAGAVAETVRATLLELSAAPSGGITLLLGLAGALWSASAYVGAFGRAMNRMYGTGEGRPIWKLRPAMLLVTLVLVLLAALTLVGLVVSGPVAEAVGRALGLDSAAVLAWQIAKWPVILLVVMLIVATLYWATPNVRQAKFRWLSLGAALAIVVWIVLSAAFGFYVSNFSTYDRTYGSLAGVIVFLLWLWLTNLALLFGAELDAELERGRELQAGIPAERTIQLPARDTAGIQKAEEKAEDDVRRGREIRQRHAEADE
ncbi:YihY/virulence factor BrkB family protein [Nocardioides euryhalodurans]|uniref:YihY/virulence factor BrkB family protein n=1 Tax=Nocardioides euryhalodurans TaxID=2518370 RepID=A0A4P7GMD6_9ACTN|nr:YihY/virulence factor BrkB family protein [Nocardioides euryhalodurans]QBR93315.1 YihY/virulence factor BrkB family protein [Nocardioides euryhalodurans]